jgi:hypothetical protein
MPEVVLTGPMIIIFIAVLIVILGIVLAIYDVKIGRLVCGSVGHSLVGAFGYSGVFIGLTDIGIDATCNPLPI